MDPTGLAIAATAILKGYFTRVAQRVVDEVADRTALALLAHVESIAQVDGPTRAALNAMRTNPMDATAEAQLSGRLAAAAITQSSLRDALWTTIGPTVPMVARSTGGPAVTVYSQGSARSKVSIRNVTKTTGGRWILGAFGVAMTLTIAACAGLFALVASKTTFFDTKTTINAEAGWIYRVSEAHVQTSAQLKDYGPAKPGYKYLYFDITVENLLDDREAPGIDLHFARTATSLSANCGAESGGFFGPVSTYVGGIVPGWCISINDGLFGGATCFETNDTLFRTVDRIPAGGRNQLRCVDSYLAKDGFDLDAIRVYYLGSSYVSSESNYPNLRQIPTTT